MNRPVQSHLGHAWRGWQKYADAFRLACTQAGIGKVGIKPKNGYLAIDSAFLPAHLGCLADCIEHTTDQICQYCGAYAATEHVQDGLILKLCEPCAARVPQAS